MTRWTAIPAARSSAPVLKVRLWLVLGSLIFAAVCGVLSMVLLLTRKEAPPPEIPPPLPTALGEAWTVANEFTAGRTISVPLAAQMPKTRGTDKSLGVVSSIEWQGYETRKPDGVRSVEYHRFLVTTAPAAEGEAPGRRVLVVPMEVTESGPLLIASPSLEPATAPADPPARIDWTDVEEQLTVSDQLKRRVESWATAFLADDRGAIQDVVNDPQQGEYAGIGGLATEKVDVPSFVALPNGDAVARARVTATHPSGWTSEFEWDLLVRNPNQGNPEIVAWGPAGVGGLLAPYQNALSGTRK